MSAFWFMVALGIIQVGGTVAFYATGKPLDAGVWFCYSGAQVFWALKALP